MTANAKLEIGKPGRGVTSETVEYTGASRSLSLVEDLEGGLVLRIGVTTNEENVTEKRPNYKLAIDLPVDHLVASFLANVMDRAEDQDLPLEEHVLFRGEYDGSPGSFPTREQLAEAIARYDEFGGGISPYAKAGGHPLPNVDAVARDSDEDDPELIEVDGKAITYPEVREFRGVVPGHGDGIRVSEVEAFRRFRILAEKEEAAFVDSLEETHQEDLGPRPDVSLTSEVQVAPGVLTDHNGTVLELDGIRPTIDEIEAYRAFKGHSHLGYIQRGEVEDFRTFRKANTELPKSCEELEGK